MSFLVRYPVGNTNIRDCQYWPTITHEVYVAQLVAGGYTLPNAEAFVTALETTSVSMTRDTLMQMAWRVRTWTISGGSFSFSGINPVTTNTWSMNGTWNPFTLTMRRDSFGGRLVTDEQDILGPNTDYANDPPRFPRPHTLLNAGIFGNVLASGGNYREPASGDPGPIFGGGFASLFGGYVIYDTGAQRFYPPKLGPFFSFGSSPIAPSADVTFSILGGATDGTFTVIDPAGGPNLVKGLKVTGLHTGNSANEGTGTVSPITMTATSWWPYKNSLNQAVWDTTTGAQINDPFS